MVSDTGNVYSRALRHQVHRIAAAPLTFDPSAEEEHEITQRILVLQRAVHPPSIKIVCPVINDAADDARNTTAPATSIG